MCSSPKCVVATLCRLQRPGFATEMRARPAGSSAIWSVHPIGTATPRRRRDPTSPVCTRRMRFPSFTQALLDPAKLTSANLSVVFSRFANCAIGGAAYSPMPYMMRASVSPARPTGQAIRQTDTPEARVTTSSLPEARLPRPISAPIIAPIGSSSNACCGRLSIVNRKASAGAVAADADIALLTDEHEQRTQGQQHGHRHGGVDEHGAIQVAIENVHAVLASRTTR